MHKTLIVRACAIGDFVLNIPALLAMQNLHYDAQFTFVGYPDTLALVRKFVPSAAIHSVDSDPWKRLFYEPVSDLQFDSAVVWMKDPDFAVNLRASDVPNVVRADPFPGFGHAATHLLRTLGLPEPLLPDLWEPSSARIIIHPGSGSPKKRWPFFDELISQIPEAFVLRGPAEGSREILPLTEVCELLCQSRAYIGNDSGITHLAAYLGVPTVALFGPTDPRTWGPIGRRSRVIWKTRLEDISVGEVHSILQGW